MTNPTNEFKVMFVIFNSFNCISPALFIKQNPDLGVALFNLKLRGLVTDADGHLGLTRKGVDAYHNLKNG
jgi:hypothetical protein